MDLLAFQVLQNERDRQKLSQVRSHNPQNKHEAWKRKVARGRARALARAQRKRNQGVTHSTAKSA
jgi:hypothetical protein